MSRFVLTAQLQLQAPRNTRQVVNQMQQQLQNVNVQINPVINNQALSNANKQLTKVSASAQSVSKNLRGASRSAESFGSALGAAARRFASITLATGFFLGITRAMGSAVGRAVEFEKEMLKISQVTGKTVRGLQDLSNEVTKLSTTFGVSSEEILGAARTLSQAGLAADQVTKSLRVLAQTDLAATFDNIADTTEGAVALINQFRKEVRAAGSEAKFLEKALDAINAVSKNFAVESADLISVVRRTGGVFEAAGGQLNELIALFTSVRSTTRETADTIATGFRTIFTRIQRTETIDQLRELGIVLQDSTGKFVGPLDAIKRLSAGLSALDPRDFRFNEIVEQLGGFRQIGKVIPLIKQYSTSVAALSVANNSMGSTAKDAQIAQQGLGNQFAQLKEKFDATIRAMVDSGTFRSLADGAIRLAEAVLKIVDAMEPLLPMLTALAAFKLGQIAVPALGRFAGVTGKNQGGRIHGFNKGGMVPGRGNRDTVPAMLQPGEFVMRKSAVKKIGANNMAQMNNGYAAGGVVTGRRSNYGKTAPASSGQMSGVAAMGRNLNSGAAGDADGEVDKFLFSAPPTTAVAYTQGANAGAQSIKGPLSMKAAGNLKERLTTNAAGIPGNVKNAIGMEDIIELNFPYFAAKASEPLAEVGTERKIQSELEASVTKMSTDIASRLDFDIPPAITTDEQTAASRALEKIDTKTIAGYVFEAVISTLTNVGTDSGAGFDYINTSDAIPRFNKIFGPDIPANTQAIEAKRTKDSGSIRGKENSLLAKIAASALPNSPSNVGGKLGVTLNKVAGKERGGKIQGFASGGKPKGTDTVPAMLTPGEYVIKKSSAQSIGYANLERMNQSNGVNGYAAGGIVTARRGNYGTMPSGVAGGGGMNIGAGVNTSMEALASSATKLSYQLDTIASSISAVVDDFAALQNIDDKINGAADTLANSIASAVDDINILQSIDDKLLGAIQPLSNSILTAGAEVSKGVQNFATGMSTIDDHFKAQIDATIGAVKTAMADFAKGLSTIDNTLKQQFSGPGKLVEQAMTELKKHLTTFGTELTEKVKLFDQLTKPVGDTVAAMEKFAQSLVGRLDDLNPLSTGAGLMANGLNNASALWTQGIQIMLKSLGGAVVSMRNALLAGASGFTVVNPFAGLSQMTAPVAQLMGQLQTTLRTVGTQFNTLAQNLAALNASIQAGNTSITQVAGAAFDTDEFFNRLEASIQQFITQMQTAGTAATKVGTGAPATGGAATGGAVMTGGMGGGGKDMTGMMNNLMMAGMMAGMLAQQMSFLSDKTQKAVMDFTMLASILGMVAMSAAPGLGAALFKLGGSALVTAASNSQQAAAAAAVIAADAAKAAAAAPPAAADALKTIAADQAAIADALKATAAKKAAVAENAKTGTITAATIALVGLAVIAAVVMMKMNAQQAAADKLVKGMGEQLKAVQEGNLAASTVATAHAQLRQALQNEAEAAAGGTGALIAAIAVTALAVIAIGATFGAATPLVATLAAISIKAAVGFVAVAAAAAAAGYSIGASYATVEDAALGLGESLITGAVLASQALGSLSLASKAAELAQLEGAEALAEINNRYEGIAANADGVIQSMIQTADIRSGVAGNTDVDAAELGDNETLKKVSEMSEDALQKFTEQLFDTANKLRAAGAEQVDAMLAEGMDVDKVLNTAEIQRNFKNLERAVAQATFMHLKQSGAMKQEAKTRLGLAGVAEENLTAEQAVAVSVAERALIEEKANETAEAARKAEEDRIRAADKARKKQDALEARELAASQEAARSAYALAQSFNAAQMGLLNLNNSFNAVNVTFSRLSGSITQFKSNLDKQIASLATGDLTTENVGAAKAVGDAFGIGAQVDSLLGSIKETENVRKVLIEKGTKEFTGKLSETAASLRWEDFLDANNLDLSMLSDDIQGEIKEMLEDGLQPQEIETIVGHINDANQKQIKLLQELAVAQQKYLSTIFKFGGAIIKAEQQFRSAMTDLVKVTQTGAARMAKALGRDLTVKEVGRNEAAMRNAKLGDLAGGGTAKTGADLGAREAAMASIDKQIRQLSQSAGNEEQIIKLQNRQRELGDESDRLRGHLKALSDQSKLAAAVMKEIDKEAQKRAAVVGFIDDFTFATNKERGEINKGVMALQRVMQTGTLASIPDDMRGAVSGLLDQFSDIAIGPQGQTGDEVRRFLQVQTANQMSMAARGRPLTAEEADKIFNRTTREEELINTLQAISQQEQAAARELAQHQLNKQDELVRTLQELVVELRNNMMKAGEAAGPAVEANPFALGGVVYASEGKSIFKPKGTDTVPAMLTPGEFVVNKQAASRNAGALHSINSGKTKYLAGGGSVGTIGSYDANHDPAFKKNFDPTIIKNMATTAGERAGKLAGANTDKANEATRDGFSADFIRNSLVTGNAWPWTKLAAENYRVPVPGWKGAVSLNKKTLQSYEIYDPAFNDAVGILHALSKPELSAKITSQSLPPDLPSLPGLGSIADYYNNYKMHAGYWYNGGWQATPLDPTDYDIEAHYTGAKTAGQLYDDAAEFLTYAGESKQRKWAMFQMRADQQANDQKWGNSQAMRTLRNSIFSDGRYAGSFIQRVAMNPKITSDDDDDVSAGKYGYAPKPAWTKGSNDQPQFQWSNDFFANGRDHLKKNEIRLQAGADPDVASMLTEGFAGNSKQKGFFQGLGDKQSSLLKVVYGQYAKYLDFFIKNETKAIMGYLKGDFSLFATDKVKGTKEVGNVAGGQIKALMQSWSVQEWFKTPGGQDAMARSNELHPAMQLVTDLGNNFLNSYLADASSWKEDPLLANSYAAAGLPLDSLGLFSNYEFGMQDYAAIVTEGNKKLINAGNLWNKLTPADMESAKDGPAAKRQRENFAQLMENITKPLGISFNAKGRLKEAEKQKNEQQQAAAKQDLEEKQGFLAENKKLNANLDFGIFNDRAGFMKQAQDFMMENKLFQYRTPSYAFKYGLPKSASRLHRVPPTAGSFNALFPYSMFIAKELQNFSRGNLLLGMGADNVSLNKALIRQSLGNVVRDQAGNIVWESTINPQTGVGSADLNAAIKTVNKQGQWSRLFFSGGRQFFGPRGVLGTFTGTPYEDWFTGIGGYKGLTDAEKQISALYFKDPSFTNGGFSGAMVKELQGLWKELTDTYKAQAAILKQRPGAQPQIGPAQAAGNFATGGPVGVSFKPKGTDTVPAMLTPGEFVMKKSAVDKYGMGFMSAINGGGIDNTGPYFSTGGPAGGRAVSQFGAAADRRLDKVLNTVKSNSTGIKDVKESVSKITNNTANIAAKTANNELLADQSTAKATLRQAQVNSLGIEENNDDIGDIYSTMLTSSEYESLFKQLKRLKKHLKNANPVMKGLSRDLGAAQGALNQILFLVQNQDLARAFNFGELAAQIGANAFNPGAFLAKGGSVPGVGNQDTVSAMLTPGEFVMKKSAVGKYGSSFMSAINSGAIPQMFAMGGAVIPPKFWQTNTVGKAEDPNRVNAITRMLGFGNKSLFGGEMAKKYMQNVNDQGRGVWRQYEKAATADFFPTDFTNVSDSNYGSLYVRNRIGNDGDVMAFMLKRMADIRDINFGLYNATVPQFGVDGPYRFGNPAWDNPFFTGNDPVGSVTTGQFASMWIPFAKRLFLPGYDGLLGLGPQKGRFANDRVLSYSENLRNQAQSFIKKALTDGTWNPIANPRAFNNQRVIAGYSRSMPAEVIGLVEKAAQQQGIQLGKIAQNAFPATSFFAKGGMARGTDTVPAMLTPGEFVMKKSAVQKHGLGFMRSINDSGPSTRVGRGVQYKHEGDVMGAGGGFDFSGLSDSIGQLGSQVSTSLSAFESAFLGFSKLSRMLSDTINSIASLNITHTVNISGSLSIPGFSQQAINDIVKTISDQIADSTNGKVKRALNRFKRDQDNRT